LKVYACPKCGSKNIRQGTMGDGVLTGYTTKDVCRDCGYQGSPLIFDAEEDYKKFLEGLKKEKEQEIGKNKEKVDCESDLSEKEKQVIDFLKEYDEEKPKKTTPSTWPKNKIWWPEIGIALIIAAAISITGLFDVAVIMGVGGALIYTIIGFISSFVIILFMIAFIEYVIYSLAKSLV